MFRKCEFFLLLIIVLVLSSCQRLTWVQIGVIEDQSGSYKETYQSISNGRSLAISEISSQGNHGWKIKLKTGDSMNLPEKAANLLREMSDQVDFFLGISSADSAQVAKYVAHYRNKVFITETIEDTVIDHVSTTLLFQQTPINIGKLAVRYFFSNLKKDRMAVLYDQSNRSFSNIAKGFSSEGSLIGAQVYLESYDSSVQKVDFNRLLARVQSVNPQIIFFCSYENDLEEMLKLVQNSFTIPAMFFSNLIPNDISLKSQAGLYKNLFCISTFYDKKDAFLYIFKCFNMIWIESNVLGLQVWRNIESA